MFLAINTHFLSFCGLRLFHCLLFETNLTLR